MKPASRILVTGAAGTIGRVTCRSLRETGHDVVALDCHPHASIQNLRVVDLTHRPLLDEIFKGVKTLIHLAATPEDADFTTELVPNNLIALHHVLEAAQTAGVQRVLLASTGQVVMDRLMRGPWPVGADAPLACKHWYAATKAFAEAAGEMMARRNGWDLLAVRLGACPRNAAHAREIEDDEIARDAYLSPRDLARFVTAFANADAGFGYQVVHAVSRPVLQWRLDPEPARKILGYEPQDRWAEYLDEYWQ